METQLEKYYIGWDVGGWNCNNNRNSRDAVVILNQKGIRIGKPWRGNLTNVINISETAEYFIELLFGLTKVTTEDLPIPIVIAVDTPLGYSNAFRDLINKKGFDEKLSTSHQTNNYLFRQTEQYLKKDSLSAVKDMIGSQSTKGMHVVAKFAPKGDKMGIWESKSGYLTIIETYPATCTNQNFPPELQTKNKAFDRDVRDAFTCANIAYIFDKQREELQTPVIDDKYKDEGWIWTFKDAYKDLKQN